MQAVVKIGGSQYLVSPGQEILVDHLTSPAKQLTFLEVLLTIDGKDVRVGQPFLPGLAVTATLMANVKGEKIRVAKFKAKSRYRKAVGFRPLYSRIKIESVGSPSPVSAPTAPAKASRRRKAV